MHQPAPDKQPEVQPSVYEKHTEVSQSRQSTRFHLGKRFPTYTQEYASVTTIPGEIMAMNTRIYIRTKIYAKASVSDPDTIYFYQATKKNYSTQFLKSAHKEFTEFLS